jgi:type IV secretion system protein VirB9
MRKQFLFRAVFALQMVIAPLAFAQPVITDSRIKTLVYNENDVYSLLTHHGYQASIEFGEKESVRTISVGDRTSWQIIPDNRRIFLRSLVAGANTNMTVITNLRSYQFDIRATKGGVLPVREDLVYLVRFYYPDEHIPASAKTLPPVYSDELVGAALADEKAQNLPPLNFNYTYTGDTAGAPKKIFDDGAATYFQLAKPAKIFLVTADKKERAVSLTQTSDGFLKASMVAPRFVIRYDDESYLCVYNEQLAGGAVR